MSVFNQSRSRVIKILFVVGFLIIAGQLAWLQLFPGRYRQLADENAILRTTVYPERGLVFDRHRQAILTNTLTYDLMVTPSQVGRIDTAYFCRLMEIDTATFRKRIIAAIIRNRAVRPSVFEAALSPRKMARMEENLSQFSRGFYLQERPVRAYPFDCAANIVGYIGEVDSGYLRRHTGEGYQAGDYAGMTGIESTYEKALMGERGTKYFVRDNFNRVKGSYRGGEMDEPAVAGKSLYTSIDVSLQAFGERLMKNKVGAIVAIDPKTGGVLAMVSSPTYEPGLLTGSERRKHFSELFQDPRLPLLNRSMSAYYPPGSTFKTLQALLALHEGVITPQTTFSCNGAYRDCGKPMKCLDPGVFSLTGAITHSCNTYFANVMRRVIENKIYPDIDSSLTHWAHYMNAFGLGHKLGIDLPNERNGLVPVPATYDKMYGRGRWNFCTFRSVSIGQGEVLSTPLQMANEMAYLANRGWFITPHIVDSIEGGMLDSVRRRYTDKHYPLPIPDEIFTAVFDGMQGVVDNGTGRQARVPGIVVCGKTGTAENEYKGVKQKDHSVFTAFAPRENPRIVIAVICENAGSGGSVSAPVAGLMIEKFLNDTVAATRMPVVERIENLSIIPARMLDQIRARDSLTKVRENERLLREKMKMMKDTLQSEFMPEDEFLRKDERRAGDTSQSPNGDTRRVRVRSAGILPDDPRVKKPNRPANR